MSDRKFTLIELHLDGNQLWPGSLGGLLGSADSEETPVEQATTETAQDDAEEESSGSGAIGAVVALAVLVAIGVVVKRYRGGEETEDEADDQQPDVIVN